MATEQIIQYCKICRKKTVHFRQKPSHVLHLLLSVITVGLWLPIWLLVSVAKSRAQCTECGKRMGLIEG